MHAKEPTQATLAAQADAAKCLPQHRDQDFENAKRGFIATITEKISNAEGKLIWNVDQYAFLKSATSAPGTVNPSLWDQARVLELHGLFKVAEGIYQVRGFDISNITFIEGKTGVIVVDPLISAECAKAAIELYYKHVGHKPVVAVIYSHSHTDHYGGVMGVIKHEDVGKVRIIAPEEFMEHSVSENLMAGPTMRRRAAFMFGTQLSTNEKGNVVQVASRGSVQLVPPTEYITKSPETVEIDGVQFVFQLTPETEAPSEMNFFLPEKRALLIAEITSNMMHNILTPRGALVRDAKRWSFYINEALEWFGEDTDVLLQSHHWPRWGTKYIGDFLRKQRDLYAFMHDQTLRMMNQGYRAIEIAEELKLPPSLACETHCRGYYGTLSHNTKAIYQRYIGWWDANPANLHSLPPVEAGKHYVEFMGGAAELLKKAKASYEKGEYRWVAQVVNHLVFADPGNMEARHLQADALEQLGYQAESGSWRNLYLSGAHELRGTLPPMPEYNLGLVAGHALALPIHMLFNQFAIRLNGPRAGDKQLSFHIHFSDVKDEGHYVFVENAVLHNQSIKNTDKVDARVDIARLDLLMLMMMPNTLDEMLSSGDVKIEGSGDKFKEFITLFDRFDPSFNITLPRGAATK